MMLPSYSEPFQDSARRILSDMPGTEIVLRFDGNDRIRLTLRTIGSSGITVGRVVPLEAMQVGPGLAVVLEDLARGIAALEGRRQR
jgi:hypothetical protein